MRWGVSSSGAAAWGRGPKAAASRVAVSAARGVVMGTSTLPSAAATGKASCACVCAVRCGARAMVLVGKLPGEGGLRCDVCCNDGARSEPSVIWGGQFCSECHGVDRPGHASAGSTPRAAAGRCVCYAEATKTTSVCLMRLVNWWRGALGVKSTIEQRLTWQSSSLCRSTNCAVYIATVYIEAIQVKTSLFYSSISP